MVPIFFSEVHIELKSKKKTELVIANHVTKGFTIEECSKRLSKLVLNRYIKGEMIPSVKKIRHLKRLSSGVND